MDESLRIDKLLYFLRLAKSRTLAQGWAQAGHIRINGKRVERAHMMVHIGDIITLPKGDDILVIKIKALPHRRGPAAEAQSAYILISDSDKNKK